MWPFDRKPSARRREIRRSKAERGLGWRGLLPTQISALSLLIAAGASVAAAVILNIGEDPLKLLVGERVGRAITARLAFQVANEQQTQVMRIRASDNTPNYYQRDDLLLQEIRGRLITAFQLARENADTPERLSEAAAPLQLVLNEDAIGELLRIASQTDSSEYQDYVEQAIRELARQPLVEASDAVFRRTAVYAVLVSPEQPEGRSEALTQLLPSNVPESADRAAAGAARMFPRPLQASMRASITKMLIRDEGASKPIYRFDHPRSVAEAQAAANAVQTQYDKYEVGTLLAKAGNLTASELDLLREELRAFQAARRETPESRRAALLESVGRGSLAALLIFGLAAYTNGFRRRVLLTPGRQLTTSATLLALLLAARLMFVSTGLPHYAIGAQALAAGLLAIIYKRGSVIAICGTMAMLITLATRESVGFFLILLATSTVQLFGLSDIRNRGRIVAVGAAAALIALATNMAAGLVQGQSLSFVFWQQAIWSALTVLFAGFLIEGILPGVERAFGISTNMTLLEWCDASKPLMRVMAAEAPGTYNHSLLVGALAESAADAVGGNGLLCRAGAYYHDIGKVNKPEYFVENQQMGVSRHDRLSPAMSHLIIIGHVKDGTEMAKEYGVPPVLRPFIAEHHGTTLVEYFYHAATRARKQGDPEVSETAFRYPGPKPQSKETAILMVCDAVEGAVRAMSEPTAGRIEDTVSKIIQKRLMDGQFDECDLTFRELATIEATVVKTLCGIYHARIVYPEDEEPKAPRAKVS